jgi:hypothetical protein
MYCRCLVAVVRMAAHRGKTATRMNYANECSGMNWPQRSRRMQEGTIYIPGLTRHHCGCDKATLRVQSPGAATYGRKRAFSLQLAVISREGREPTQIASFAFLSTRACESTYINTALSVAGRGPGASENCETRHTHGMTRKPAFSAGLSVALIVNCIFLI